MHCFDPPTGFPLGSVSWSANGFHFRSSRCHGARRAPRRERLSEAKGNLKHVKWREVEVKRLSGRDETMTIVKYVCCWNLFDSVGNLLFTRGSLGQIHLCQHLFSRLIRGTKMPSSCWHTCNRANSTYLASKNLHQKYQNQEFHKRRNWNQGKKNSKETK